MLLSDTTLRDATYLMESETPVLPLTLLSPSDASTLSVVTLRDDPGVLKTLRFRKLSTTQKMNACKYRGEW